MNEFLSQLLGLRSLRLGDPGVEFGFERPIPPWGWALVALVAAFFAWRCYRRQEGSRVGRVFLGSLRALLLCALALLISGPRLIKPNETEERDWVLVLVDRSASMSIRDAAKPDSPRDRITREEQLRAAIQASQPIWHELAAERVLVWLGFDSSAYELDTRPPVGGTGPVVNLGQPLGRRTNLARALDQALKRAAARPLSGVVVISDGRTLDEPSRAVLRRLEAERIPVFSVPLGSPQPLADVAVRHVEGPRVAFTKDSVPVEVEVERTGGDPSGHASTDVVELIDSATGAVLDSHDVDWSAAVPPTPTPGAENSGQPVEQVQRVTLSTRPSIAGQIKWSVRIRPRDASASAPDLVEDNNSADLALELVDRPLRVIFLDGYPRWEYRFIKNLLVREESITSAVMILAPGRRYLQEGSITLDSLPRSPEEWAKFDAIILGDCLPSVFTNEQLEQIKDRVAVAGAGLVWVGGEGATPMAWRGTPLADLLPFTVPESTGTSRGGSPGSGGIQAWDEPIIVRPTLIADHLGVLRLSDEQVDGSWWPRQLSDPATGWSQLRWAQRIDPALLKPTAEVLAIATPAAAGADPPPGTPTSPLVISMRFGAGRSLYVATDETWRWRYGRGDFFPERFWIQMVRLLGRESLARSGKPAALDVTPRRGEVDKPVRVQITLLDQNLVDAAPPSLRVRIVRESAVGTEGPRAPEPDAATTELTLMPEASSAAHSSDPTRPPHTGAQTFATTWIAPESGKYRIEAIDPLLTALGPSGRGIEAKIEVWQPDDELRRPQTDHALLARLADATGGKTLPSTDLSQLPKLLPNRRVYLAGEPDVETLWDTPLALALVIILATLEWIGRRLIRLA